MVATATSRSGRPTVAWRRILAPYQEPDLRRALWQIGNTFVPYCALWALMYWSLEVSYGLTLGLAVVAAGFLLRVFIMCHDCGHRSFFKSRRRNDALGFVSGVLTFTPFHYWRHTHDIHHATAGNLDRRGVGDIWTMTVREYRESSRWRRLQFRLYRNPFVLFFLAPLFVFLIKYRFAALRAGWRWHRSVLWSNLALLLTAAVLSAAMGLKAYLLIQLPVLGISAVAGIWLFYVQHQFDGVYWERSERWDHFTTAMKGSSFYKLPRVLQWFSGNIGFHHIHHLNPRIPNYHLERCHRENPLFHKVKTLRLWASLRTIRYRLWDEEQQKLVGMGTAWL